MVVLVDPSNAKQLAAWDGEAGEFWARRAERFDAGVAEYHDRLLAAAAIEKTANVLDIGCGAGKTTRDAARLADEGAALGVDLSARMIELARRKAERENLRNVTFAQADAQVYPFQERQFDVAISRHGAMFFVDPDAAFNTIANALRAGGRLVLLTWRSTNNWMTNFRTILAAGRELPAQGKPGPASLSDPADVRKLLSGNGFRDIELRELNEPMYFGADVEDACEFISGQLSALTRDLDDVTKNKALDDLRDDMAKHIDEKGVRYDSAAWLITARVNR